MEAHVADEVSVAERDITRVERAIKSSHPMSNIFPRLSSISNNFEGEGAHIVVHFTKKQGAPVTFVPADDPSDALAIRNVDLQRKYSMGAINLAERLEITPPKSKALRWFLDIDSDPDCRHVFNFGKRTIPQYSDNALKRMRDTLNDVDILEVWRNYQNRAK